MARINLLPWRDELREERKKQFVVVLVSVMAMAGGLVFAADTLVNNRIDYQTSRNRFVEKEIALLDDKIREIKELKKQKAELLDRMQVIQELQGNRPVIVRIFDELVRSMPDGVYFNSVERKNNQLSIKGVAESNQRVSALMRNLDNSIWFSQPNLTSIKADQENDELSVFEMTVIQQTPKKRKSDEDAV